MTPEDEARAIDDVIERVAKLRPDVGRQEIVDRVGAARAEFADRPIRDFVPLFVERSVLSGLGTSVQVAQIDADSLV